MIKPRTDAIDVPAPPVFLLRYVFALSRQVIVPGLAYSLDFVNDEIERLGHQRRSLETLLN